LPAATTSGEPVDRAGALRAFLEEHRARVETALLHFLPTPPACPTLLGDAMRYSLMAGGKRLRPLLALASADAVAPGSAQAMADALPAACAVEFIHTYSLIHDDLPAMDNDSLRRGQPTLHVVYGDGIAILAGDALQAEAFALLAREPERRDPAIAVRQLRAAGVIADAAGATGMVGGQTLDLQGGGQVPRHHLTLDADGLRAMHLRKTGALIRASAVSGAIMGGGSDSQVHAIGEWATEVGLAFQIVDDILDVEGTAGELGKTAGKDAAGDKPTYPALFGLDRARAMAAECSARAHAILSASRLTGSHLDGIADWVITRKN
jgi:geranylgeranyl diphosphate synthase type II